MDNTECGKHLYKLSDGSVLANTRCSLRSSSGEFLFKDFYQRPSSSLLARTTDCYWGIGQADLIQSYLRRIRGASFQNRIPVARCVTVVCPCLGQGSGVPPGLKED